MNISTPEQKALSARHTLKNATIALCLVARGNGVSDDRLKALILTMRSPEIAIFDDVEALDLIQYLELAEA